MTTDQSQQDNSIFDQNLYRAPLTSRGNLLLPVSAKRISGGVWLYGAVQSKAVLAHVISGWLAALSIRLTPGSNTHWHPPMPGADIEILLEKIEEDVGKRIADAVIQLPSDRRRRRFSLLLTDQTSSPVAFAKFTLNPPNRMAIDAFRKFGEDPPEGYWAPRLLGAGMLGGYSYTVTSAMPNRPHVPARLSPQHRRVIIEDIQNRLADLSPDDAVVIHGDFGAWNVRSFRHGPIAIVDWEATGQGVPAADELWHAISWVSARSSRADAERLLRTEFPDRDPAVVSLAAQFWLEQLNQPEAEEIDPEKPMPTNLKTAATTIRDLLEELSEIS